MPPRTLSSLAHALGAASDLDAALVALGEALSDVDRSAVVALFTFDARAQILRERLTPEGSVVTRVRTETTLDHLPTRIRTQISSGGQFADLGEQSDEYGRLLGISGALSEEGLLALRGVQTDGHLAAVLALLEPRRLLDWRAWTFLYLALAIGSSISLSGSDLKGALAGFGTLALLVLVANLATLWLGDPLGAAVAWLARWQAVGCAAMLFALAVNALAALVVLAIPGRAPR